jgi:hypothetical protein
MGSVELAGAVTGLAPRLEPVAVFVDLIDLCINNATI